MLDGVPAGTTSLPSRTQQPRNCRHIVRACIICVICRWKEKRDPPVPKPLMGDMASVTSIRPPAVTPRARHAPSAAWHTHPASGRVWSSGDVDASLSSTWSQSSLGGAPPVRCRWQSIKLTAKSPFRKAYSSLRHGTRRTSSMEFSTLAGCLWSCRSFVNIASTKLFAHTQRPP